MCTIGYKEIELSPHASRIHFKLHPLDAHVDFISARGQHGGQVALAATIGNQRSLCAVGSEWEQFAIVTATAFQTVFPFVQHCPHLGNMRTQTILLLRFGAINQCQPGPELALLAVLLIPLQGHGDTDGNHVGIRRATLLIGEFDAPIRLLVRLGQ